MTKKELESENLKLKFELEWLKTLVSGMARNILEEVKRDEQEDDKTRS